MWFSVIYGAGNPGSEEVRREGRLVERGPRLGVANGLELDPVEALASSRRLDAVDAATRESIRVDAVFMIA